MVDNKIFHANIITGIVCWTSAFVGLSVIGGIIGSFIGGCIIGLAISLHSDYVKKVVEENK